jgi:oligopeptide transport system ATP-binding protein
VRPPGKIVSGRISFHRDGQEVILTELDAEAMRRIRGNEIAMIFQEPMTSLNPVFTIGNQIAEAVALHQGAGRKEAWEKAVEMLAQVGVPGPRERARAYPHQLSGGMRQRAMIAMALCCRPRLLLADEPTTALDVTIQAQVLDLMRALQREIGMSIILITHDLGAVSEMADDLVVMYAGRVVETGSLDALFYEAMHPYTQGLLASVPVLGRKSARLSSIPGALPNGLALPPGCAFGPRCKHRMDRCRQMPELLHVEEGHAVRCWLHVK